MPPVLGALGAAGGAIGGALPAIGGIAQGIGGLFGGGAAAESAERESKRRRAAYAEALARSQGMAEAGEKGFLSSVAQAPEEMAQAQEAIAKGATRGQEQARGETALTLAQQGVRGGQAGMIQAEQAGGLGERLTEQQNKLAYDEAVRRAGLKSQYFGGKAARGQAGVTAMPAF